jgi:hypothetical protein
VLRVPLLGRLGCFVCAGLLVAVAGAKAVASVYLGASLKGCAPESRLISARTAGVWPSAAIAASRCRTRQCLWVLRVVNILLCVCVCG